MKPFHSKIVLALIIGSVIGHDEAPCQRSVITSTDTSATLGTKSPFLTRPANLKGSVLPKKTAQSSTTVARVNVAENDLQLWLYQLILDPGAPVLRQESTLIVPATPPDRDGTPGFQSLWPAVLPATNALLQNVLTTACQGAQSWCLLPYYCCHGAHELINLPGMRVYPGDEVTNIYVVDVSNGKWFQNWAVSPGSDARKNSKPAYGGGLIFDPKVDNSTTGMPYTRTAIALELQYGRTWNFGRVEWRNIIIEAKTNETEWCLKPTVSDVLEGSYTAPVATVDGDLVSCYIASFKMIAPKDGPKLPVGR